MVATVDPVLARGRSTFSASGLVFMLLFASWVAGPLGFSEHVRDDLEGRDLGVRLPGVMDEVELFPHDPRTPPLAKSAPGAAEGLFLGYLKEREWRLHLVWTEDVALGVLDHPAGALWVTVESGWLVPFEPDDLERGPQRLGAPIVLPRGLGDDASSSGSGADDGVLQIALDGDSAFHDGLEETWQEAQLMVIHLVDGIYQANLGFSFEVVSQHTWTIADPQPFVSTGNCFDVLPSFREYWETESPTTDDVREVMHLFAGEPFDGTTIGCAYIRQLDTSGAYGVSEVPGKIGNVALDLHRHAALVSHEIGHNFDGIHSLALGVSCNGGTIMFDTLCANSPVFSGAESLALCKAGVNSGCGAVFYGNAHRMWSYGSDRI